VPLEAERGYHVMFANRISACARAGFGRPQRLARHMLRRHPCHRRRGVRRPDAPADMRIARHGDAARQQLVPGLTGEPASRWMGPRPSHPDSKPVIGRSPRHRNVFFAFGHDHLGLTMAGITGKLVAELADRQTYHRRPGAVPAGSFLRPEADGNPRRHLQMDFSLVWNYAHLWVKGLGVTLAYSMGTVLGGMIIGVICGMLLLTRRKWVTLPVHFYVEIFRCTPLLVQIVWFYYALPIVLAIELPDWFAAGLGLTLYMGAFATEIFRGGIISIDKGQWQASRALGMTGGELMRHIILPQATKRMVPPFVNQSIIQLKNTSLLYVVAIPTSCTRARSSSPTPSGRSRSIPASPSPISSSSIRSPCGRHAWRRALTSKRGDGQGRRACARATARSRRCAACRSRSIAARSWC
jgi:polar amino acid transport system permease protein